MGLPGFQHLVERFIAGALDAVDDEPSALRALTTLMQAWLAVWAGQADAALLLLDQAASDAHWLGQAEVLGYPVWIAGAFAQALRGDAEAALEAIQRPRQALEGLGDITQKRFRVLLFDSIEVRIASAVGRQEVVLDAAERLERNAVGIACKPASAQGVALQGHAALARGDRAGAVRLWEQAQADGAQLRVLGLELELRVRLAAWAAENRKTVEAAHLLRPVLARAAREYVPLPCLLAGRDALDRLASHDWQVELAPEEIRPLRQWRQLAPAAEASTRPAAARNKPLPASSELTQREIEVLERLAAGDSNKVIARAFELSPYTVKRHVANLLDKLGVSSRGQAAAWFNARTR